jgi:Cysteine-rich secretory protein family
MRRLLLAVTLALTSTTLVALAPTAAHAEVDCSADGFVASANSVRAGQGLAPYEWDGGLAAKASGWAQTMADAGSIFHSNLPDGVSADWYRLGENVGKGPDTGSIAAALIASPGHYANLIDPGFRYVGVGVVSTSDTCYVAEEFMELASQPAPSTSASAAGTPTSGDSSGRSSSRAASSGSASDGPAVEPSPPPPPPPPPPPARLTTVLERLRDLDG